MRVSVVTRTVVVRNPQGLHARPADMLAKEAMRFSARVEIVGNGQRIDAKSILNILTLGATQGAELLLEAEGEDADKAIESLAGLIESDLEPSSPSIERSDSESAEPSDSDGEPKTSGE